MKKTIFYLIFIIFIGISITGFINGLFFPGKTSESYLIDDFNKYYSNFEGLAKFFSNNHIKKLVKNTIGYKGYETINNQKFICKKYSPSGFGNNQVIDDNICDYLDNTISIMPIHGIESTEVSKTMLEHLTSTKAERVVVFHRNSARNEVINFRFSIKGWDSLIQTNNNISGGSNDLNIKLLKPDINWLISYKVLKN